MSKAATSLAVTQLIYGLIFYTQKLFIFDVAYYFFCEFPQNFIIIFRVHFFFLTCIVTNLHGNILKSIFEPRQEKTNGVVSTQVGHKQAV